MFLLVPLRVRNWQSLGGGGLVTEVVVPAFDPMPEAIAWGSRTFIRHPDGEYVEGLLYVGFTASDMQKNGWGTVGPVTPYKPRQPERHSPALNEAGFPRRNDVNELTPPERAIREARLRVEEAGAHPLLTETGCLLAEAQEKFADWVELPHVPIADRGADA